MLCKECPKRKSCDELCPAAEEYANQDYISKSYMTFSELGIDSNNIVIEEQWPNIYTKYSKIIDAYELGLSVKDISKYIGVSNSYIYRIVSEYKANL